jgi:hypothetical protein
MADKLTNCVQQIIDFSKMVPGFMQLLQDDQINLLKAGSYGVMLLYAAQCFVSERNSFIYNQHVINTDSLLQQMILDDEERYFIQENVEFLRQLKQFQLSNSELAILSAIILFNPDNVNLNDQKCIYQHYQRFVELLRIDIENNRAQSIPSSLEKQQFLQQLLNLITVNLRRLTNLHFELIKSFKIKNQHVEFPPLHRELFNVDYFVYCHQQQQQQQQHHNTQIHPQQQQSQQPQQQQSHIQMQPQTPQVIQTPMMLPTSRYINGQQITLNQYNTSPSNSGIVAPKQIMHQENLLNANVSSPSPSSCSSSSSSSSSATPSSASSASNSSSSHMLNSNPPSTQSPPLVLLNTAKLTSNSSSNITSSSSSSSASSGPKNAYEQSNMVYYSSNNSNSNRDNNNSSVLSSKNGAVNYYQSVNQSSAQLNGVSTSPSSTSTASASYMNSSSIDFAQTIDDVILNNCVGLSETNSINKQNIMSSNSPSSTSSLSSSISPPSYVSLSSTYSSLIKSEQLFSNAIGIDTI